MYIRHGILLLLVCGAGPLRAQSGLLSRCDAFVPTRTPTSAPLRLVCTVPLDSLRSLIAHQARVDAFEPGTIDLGPTLADDSVVPTVVHGSWRGDSGHADVELRGQVIASLDTGVDLLSAAAHIRVALDSASVFERAYNVADALPAEYRALLQHLRVRRSSIAVANATSTEGTLTVDLDTARR